MRCPVCRETCSPELSYCPHCGSARTASARPPAAPPPPAFVPGPEGAAMQMNSSHCTRNIALLLAAVPLFCAGVGGIHHFYTGRVVFGILQLITAGGFFVWAIIDMVNIAQGNFRDSENRPLARG